MKTVEDKVKNKVAKFQELETQLTVMERQLSQNKQFKEFIKLQKQVTAEADRVWTAVEELMIAAGKKTIETDWVKLTIVEAKKNIIDEDELPANFTKIVPDTKAINAYIKENGIAPRGVTQEDNPHLRKSFRDFIS